MLDSSLGKLLLMDKMDIDDLKVPFTNYVGPTYTHSMPSACYYNNDRSKEIKTLTIVHGNNQSIVSKSRFPKLSQIIIHSNTFKKPFVP